MIRLLDVFLRLFIRRGTLRVRFPDGSERSYGSGAPSAGVHLRNERAVRALLVNPGLSFGEAYMDDDLVPLGGPLYELVELLMINAVEGGHPAMRLEGGWRWLRRGVSQFNPQGRARRNVAHHYDLDGRLYSLFLDRDRQYSCAYFVRGDETLEEAQEAKKHHIAAKLRLDRPGLRVLDIGCGWGGMALTLARDYGAIVTGITLSTEQLAEARSRVAAAGLSDRVDIQLRDYRALHETYDRVVSVGMFEHVGVGHFEAYFRAIRNALAPDGVALVHSIGRMDGPGATNAWLEKYIFPGGYSPAMSETLAAVERSGLWVSDCEVLRLHYARTIEHWRRRFAANRDTVATMHDERFCRMFELYLCGSELAFRRQGHMNFQLQLTRAIDAVPYTRDYMFEAERAATERRHVADSRAASLG